jgi:polyisoprenoid-binding protein YceI
MRDFWKIDPAHSTMGFAVKHMQLSSVHGCFRRWEGWFEHDREDITRSRAEVVIEAASLDTEEAERDAHLRSPDFLDADRFPRIVFRSTHVARQDDNHYLVTGDLTIRDVTRPISFVVEQIGEGRDPWGYERAGLALKTTVDRRSFGLSWNQILETGAELVAYTVEINIEVEGIKQFEGREASDQPRAPRVPTQ